MTLSLGEFVSVSEGTCMHDCVCVWKNASVSVVNADNFPDVMKCVLSLKLKDCEAETPSDMNTSSLPALSRRTYRF